MSTETLKVNPQVLQSAATSFDELVDALGRIQADVPLGNLNAAATSYVREDESGADAIGGVDRARSPVLEGTCCC